MGAKAKAKAEAAAHAVTLERLAHARLRIEALKARVVDLEQEAEALRDMVATVSAGGPRASL